MRKEVVQRFRRRINVWSCKHQQTFEPVVEADILRRGFDDLDVAPAIGSDPLARVDADLGTDLDTDDASRCADSLYEIGKTPAGTASRVENTITCLQAQPLDCFLSYRLDEEEIEIRKRPDEAAQESSVRRRGPRSCVHGSSSIDSPIPMLRRDIKRIPDTCPPIRETLHRDVDDHAPAPTYP